MKVKIEEIISLRLYLLSSLLGYLNFVITYKYPVPELGKIQELEIEQMYILKHSEKQRKRKALWEGYVFFSIYLT